MLMLGSPGAGTSRLTRRRSAILPPMTLGEALKITRLPRVTALTGDVSLVHYRILCLDEQPIRSRTHAAQGSG
jgi:predicted ATPase with chaperone activity